MRRRTLGIGIAVLALALVLLEPIGNRRAEAAPALSVSTAVSGVGTPWGFTFTSDGTMVYTIKDGALGIRTPAGTTRLMTADFGDLYNNGETGLMGVIADPGFASNRLIYTCQGWQSGGNRDIRVVRWQLDGGYTAATRVGAPVVAGILTTSGNHGGCRLRFDPAGLLYISTGDGNVGPGPKDPNILVGKVLRVRTDGTVAPGNASTGDPRVYTRGHRNPQGMALRPGTTQMWTAEHGPDVDDEINLLRPGGYYGWNPVGSGGSYNQSVPMTEAGATPARYASGNRTQALSGITFLSGAQWGPLEGALIAAALKDSELLAFRFDAGGTLQSGPEVLPEFNGTYGRLRSVEQGPDGALYVSTSNGSNDRILRVTPAPSARTLLLRDTPDAGGPTVPTFSFGSAVNTTLSCDVDGNGRDDVLSFNNGFWAIRPQLDAGPPSAAFAFGGAGWLPVCGDWDGNGADGIGVWDGTNWYLRNTATAGPADAFFAYGYPGSYPVVGDWTGRGADSIGIVDLTTYQWLLRGEPAPGPPQLSWTYGFRGSIPVPGNYTGDRRTELGIYAGGTWYLRTGSGPGPARVFSYGGPGYSPVIGDWNSDGVDGVGVTIPG